jgi:hypothetical protein
LRRVSTKNFEGFLVLPWPVRSEVLADPSLTPAKGSTFSFSLGVLLILILGFFFSLYCTWRLSFGGNVEIAIQSSHVNSNLLALSFYKAEIIISDSRVGKLPL